MMRPIDERAIRRLVLDAESDSIRSMLLNDRDLSLVKEIKKTGTVNSNWLAARQGKSIQCATMKLSSLHKKGYLKRSNVGADSGGIEFEYSASDEIEVYLYPCSTKR